MLYQHPENVPLLRDGIPKKTIITTQSLVTNFISRQDLTKGICHSHQYVLGFTYYLPFSVADPTNKQTNKQAKPMEIYSQNNKNSFISVSSKKSETTALVVACLFAWLGLPCTCIYHHHHHFFPAFFLQQILLDTACRQARIIIIIIYPFIVRFLTCKMINRRPQETTRLIKRGHLDITIL